jgi:hypothetical protein
MKNELLNKGVEPTMRLYLTKVDKLVIIFTIALITACISSCALAVKVRELNAYKYQYEAQRDVISALQAQVNELTFDNQNK